MQITASLDVPAGGTVDRQDIVSFSMGALTSFDISGFTYVNFTNDILRIVGDSDAETMIGSNRHASFSVGSAAMIRSMAAAASDSTSWGPRRRRRTSIVNGFDLIFENAGEGTDTVLASTYDLSNAANVENLTTNWADKLHRQFELAMLSPMLSPAMPLLIKFKATTELMRSLVGLGNDRFYYTNPTQINGLAEGIYGGDGSDQIYLQDCWHRIRLQFGDAVVHRNHKCVQYRDHGAGG